MAIDGPIARNHRSVGTPLDPLAVSPPGGGGGGYLVSNYAHVCVSRSEGNGFFFSFK